MWIIGKIAGASGLLAAVSLSASILQAQTKPPGHVVIEFKIKDADGFKTYSQRAPATVAQYGGKFTIRGGKPENLKGDGPQGPFIMLTFETAEQASKWANSPEYRELVPLRDQAADTRAFIIEGLTP